LLSCGSRHLSQETLKLRAARAATALAGSGARPGGAIAVLLRNDVAFLEVVYASRLLGAYAVPINWHFKAEEVGYILADSGATHLVAHADLLQPLRQRLPDGPITVSVPTPPEIAAAYGIASASGTVPEGSLEWDTWTDVHDAMPQVAVASDATMSYTSGTTGRPKGVRRAAAEPAQRRALAELRQQWFGHRAGMRTAIVGPLYHSVQLSYATAALSAGGEVLLVPRFDAEGLLGLIAEHRLTHLQLVPVMMRRLLQLPAEVKGRYDLSSLEFVVHGAAPCPPEVKRQMIEWWGPIFHEHYGTTEAGLVCRASSAEWLQRPGTVGRPWPGRVVRVYDEQGAVLPPNAAGEVYMSLGSLPDFTYHNSPAERAAVTRDGLVTNGDVGYLDDDGYLYLCDRKRDVVITGGVNVYPAEVEAVLAGHPAVADCAVFGVPDAEFGEALTAVVQLQHGVEVTSSELKSFVSGRLASYKVPRQIEARGSLPRDDSGKVFKRLLRDPYWAAAGRRI
jgi:long-chain acyl-CoA synthetase